MTEKLYCYVDETGQDTKGKFFVIVTIMVGKERDDLTRFIEETEEQTGKGSRKWMKSKRYLNFVRKVLFHPLFKEKIFYQTFRKHAIEDYDPLMIQTITKAIQSFVSQQEIKRYKVTIIIDGLLTPRRQLYLGSLIRKAGIITEKVKGARDQSDAFVRLADTVAGMIREGEEDVSVYKEIKQRLSDEGILQELH
jgi:hypothetical protein